MGSTDEPCCLSQRLFTHHRECVVLALSREAHGIVAIEVGLPGPHRPQDPGHFVGHCHGGFVVSDTGFGVEGPLLEPGDGLVVFPFSSGGQ